MNKKIAVAVLFSVMCFSRTMLAEMDRALTITGTKITVHGFVRGKEVREFASKLLRRYGLDLEEEEHVAEFYVTHADGFIHLEIRSIATGTILFRDKGPCDDQKFPAIKSAIRNLMERFYRLLPYRGLIYSMKGEIVKINAGFHRGLRVGDRVLAVRFKGTAPDRIDIKKEIPYSVMARIKIDKVRKYYSVGKIISSSGARRFDKIVYGEGIDIKGQKDNRRRKDRVFLEREIRFYLGFLSGYLWSKPNLKYASDEIIPDSDRNLTPLSPVPYIGLDLWPGRTFGLSLWFQYRKIPLKTQGGEKIKASYMSGSFNVRYRFTTGTKSARNIFSPALGYFFYSSTVKEPLVRYISVKYCGPSVGIEWKTPRRHRNYFAGLHLYPYLMVKEDQVTRGSRAGAMGFSADIIGLEYPGKTHTGYTGALFYRWIRTGFSGEASDVIVYPDQKFNEHYVGIRLLMTFSASI